MGVSRDDELPRIPVRETQSTRDHKHVTENTLFSHVFFLQKKHEQGGSEHRGSCLPNTFTHVRYFVMYYRMEFSKQLCHVQRT